MEVVRNPPRIINIVRQPLSFSATSRSLTSESNIFETHNLERIKMLTFDKNYSYVGLKQVKEFMRKTKKGTLSKKQGMNSSLKSYTNKSNEQEDSYFTKEEILKCFQKPENYGSSRQSWHRKIQKTSLSLFNKQNRKDRGSQGSNSKKFDEYQQKIEKLKKYTLKEKKQNIGSCHWNKVLRSNLELSQIYTKQQQNLEHIKRKGFKLKAISKQKKEQEWLQGQKDSSLFEFIENQKQIKMACEKKKILQNDIL